MNQSETNSAAGGGETPHPLWFALAKLAMSAEKGQGAHLTGENVETLMASPVIGPMMKAAREWGTSTGAVPTVPECLRPDAALAAPTAKGGTEVPADPLVAYLERQWAWSKETFGPARRTKGIVQHITKELREIEADPHDLAEWVDVIILAMDGFWRHGGKPSELLPVMQDKQDRNFARTWPDWRTMGEDQAIEHDRSGETSPPPPAGAAGGGSSDLARSEGTHDNAPVPETPVKPGISPFDTGLSRSGDLGALSAGATPGEWHYRCAKPGRAWIADAPKGRSHSKIILGQEAFYSGDADYAFVAALVSAYRSGRLIEASAPTPDLGAQGEPVADGWKLVPAKATRDWAYDLATYRQGRSLTPRCEGPTQADVAWGMDRIHEILAVAPKAPAAPRTGSGVSDVQIEAASAAYYDGMTGTAEERWPHHTGWAGKSEAFKDKVRAHMGRAMNAALFAQAPRDGGETQGVPAELSAKWACEELARIKAVIPASLAYEVPDTAEAVASTFREFVKAAVEATALRKQIAALKEGIGEPFMTCRNGVIYPAVELRYRNLRAAQTAHSALVTFFKEAPTPPSGVETIRQDNTSGGL